MRNISIFLFVILATSSIIPPTVFAQSANTYGIQVTPSIVQLDLATDSPQTILTYTNHTSETIALTFSASDVTELEDSYRVAFLNPKDAQNYKYGLSSWIEFSSTSLVLDPGQQGTLTVFIDKDKLSPGGHYGSVLAQIQSTNPTGNVTIKSILATLIFVRTHTGKEYEKGTISTFEPEQNFFDFPQNFLLRFTNSGDTYLTPYGRVLVYGMWGNVVGQGILNSGSLFVLPESLRRMEIPMQARNSILLPGIYHATLMMHFGKTNQQLSSTTTFFSLGTLPVIWIVLFLCVIGIVYIYVRKHAYFKTKEA